MNGHGWGLQDDEVGGNYEGPGIYRHHKGGEYRVLGLALHESHLYRLVIYVPLTPGSKLEGTPIDFWARPLGDFNEQVFTGGPSQEEHYKGWVPRFLKVAETVPEQTAAE